MDGGGVGEAQSKKPGMDSAPFRPYPSSQGLGLDEKRKQNEPILLKVILEMENKLFISFWRSLDLKLPHEGTLME